MLAFSEIQAILNSSNQLHLLKFWNELSDKEQQEFLQHLSGICFQEANNLFKNAINALKDDVAKVDERMKPIPPSQFESEESCDVEKVERYRRWGLEEISKGHVGVLLLAGGQGTRLGVSFPKGMYSLNLPSKKTLFQIQAERIRRVQELSQQLTGRNGRVTWYIMTSGPTKEVTNTFLEKHDFFGLRSEDVVQFQQGLLPCFDMEGRIILESKTRVALAPDGNGGIYRALLQNDILLDMEKRGVKFIHVHSVDNILVKVADPTFIGYCVAKNADCGAKVVQKASPTEALGVVCKVDGRFQVVEYSEISDSTANLRDQEGNLVFSAGSICNHFFTTRFLREVGEKHEMKMKLHVAKKRIPYVDEQGEIHTPVSSNGIKIEKFVFDAFQFSDHFVTWEVPRHSEFSALKNVDEVGKDCPSTARRDLFVLHKSYVEAAGGTIIGDVVEISPLVSYAGEDLENIVQGKVLKSPVLISGTDDIVTNGCIPSYLTVS